MEVFHQPILSLSVYAKTAAAGAAAAEGHGREATRGVVRDGDRLRGWGRAQLSFFMPPDFLKKNLLMY